MWPLLEWPLFEQKSQVLSTEQMLPEPNNLFDPMRRANIFKDYLEKGFLYQHHFHVTIAGHQYYRSLNLFLSEGEPFPLPDSYNKTSETILSNQSEFVYKNKSNQL